MPVETSEYWRLMYERHMLHAALLKYGRHQGCMDEILGDNTRVPGPCTCGLDDVLTKLQFKLPEPGEIGA